VTTGFVYKDINKNKFSCDRSGVVILRENEIMDARSLTDTGLIVYVPEINKVYMDIKTKECPNTKMYLENLI
jgi:hypothetical protein